MEKIIKKFKFFIPDSCLPDKLQLRRIKLGYLMQFGGTPFYKENTFSLLLSEISFAPKMSNGISERKSMNIYVIFFDNTK